MHARFPFLTALFVLALPGLASAATARSATTCLPTVKGVVQGCHTFAHFTGVGAEVNDVPVRIRLPAGVARRARAAGRLDVVLDVFHVLLDPDDAERYRLRLVP